MNRYKAIWIQDSPALKPGWYVHDIARSTPGARVFVGVRHTTQEAAKSAIVELELKERVFHA